MKITGRVLCATKMQKFIPSIETTAPTVAQKWTELIYVDGLALGIGVLNMAILSLSLSH